MGYLLDKASQYVSEMATCCDRKPTGTNASDDPRTCRFKEMQRPNSFDAGRDASAHDFADVTCDHISFNSSASTSPKRHGSGNVGQRNIDELVKGPHARHTPTQPATRPRCLDFITVLHDLGNPLYG